MRKQNASPWLLVGFFSIFLAVGCGVMYGLGWRTLQQSQAAQHWQQAMCEITASNIASHSDSDGTTYSLEVTYNYRFDGRLFQGDRLGFFDFSSSDYSHWRDLQQQYPRGSQHRCYVDPANPEEVVINRDLSAFELLLPFGFGGIFALVGLGGIVYALAAMRRKPLPGVAMTAQYWSPKHHATQDAAHGWRLEPKAGLKKQCAGIVALAVLWNAISWTLLIVFSDDMVAAIMLSLFVLIGLLLGGLAVKSLLALRNPYPELFSSEACFYLGVSRSLRWRLQGDVSKVQGIKIRLKGEESATYRVGTDTHTSRHTFHEEDLQVLDAHGISRQGSFRVQIPGDSMHSFEAHRNKISWEIIVSLDIPNWPDTVLHFPLLVCPHRKENTV